MAVCVALVFGVLTIRQWQRTRYLSAAAELVRTFQTPDFTRAIERVMALPEQAEAEEVRKDPAMINAVHAVVHAYDALGVLVFHRLLPLHLVDHLLGGYMRASWKRVRPYVLERRGDVGAMFGEWFQWLAERMIERPAPGKDIGAPVAFRDWRP